MKNIMLDNVPVQREYKDRIFRMLFREKKNLLSLYNALNGTNYQDESEMVVVTLENAIYMGMRNDAAFIFGSFLSLYEHQSTFNPNMPLRFLQYVSKEYEKYINKEKIYSSELLRIPEPRFVVFYNGIEEQPMELELKLSDAYFNKSVEPQLELKVRMYNINYEKNHDILKKCKVLSDYSKYVETVRNYLEVCDTTEEAVECAIQECIKDKVLEDFLIQNRSEVINMSIFEYDEEKVMNMLREEYKQRGLREGRLTGLEEGHAEGLKQGIAEGIEQGIQQGIQQGRAQGKEEGETRLFLLLRKIVQDEDMLDIERLYKDKQYREDMYLKYNL